MTFGNGNIAIENRSESLATLVSRAAPEGVYVEGAISPAADARDYSQHTYGGHFAEVGVDTVTGEVRIVAPDGTVLRETGKAFLCRCGHSANKPFCDGSHRRTGFSATERADGAKPDASPDASTSGS